LYSDNELLCHLGRLSSSGVFREGFWESTPFLGNFFQFVRIFKEKFSCSYKKVHTPSLEKFMDTRLLSSMFFYVIGFLGDFTKYPQFLIFKLKLFKFGRFWKITSVFFKKNIWSAYV